MEGKRKRMEEIELKGMGNEDKGEEKKKEEEEENRMLGVGKKVKKAKKKEGKPNKGSGGGILTNKLFSELEISEHTAKAIGEMKYTHLTEIQAKSIPHLMEGCDVMGSARTGSGKTLAFLVPAIELLHNLQFLPRNGTGVIVICPTRELAIQTYNVAKELMKYHPQTVGYVIGGTKMTSEANQLENGINVLVATPGRLLDHLRSTSSFKYNRLKGANISLTEYEFSEKLVPKVQSELVSLSQLTPVVSICSIIIQVSEQENVVGGNYFLNQLAKEAYKSYLLAYKSRSLKNIFDVHQLDLKRVAASFCFKEPPKVHLDLESSASKHRKMRKVLGGRGHGIGSSNPYGRRVG